MAPSLVLSPGQAATTPSHSMVVGLPGFAAAVDDHFDRHGAANLRTRWSTDHRMPVVALPLGCHDHQPILGESW